MKSDQIRPKESKNNLILIDFLIDEHNERVRCNKMFEYTR